MVQAPASPVRRRLSTARDAMPPARRFHTSLVQSFTRLRMPLTIVVSMHGQFKTALKQQLAAIATQRMETFPRSSPPAIQTPPSTAPLSQKPAADVMETNQSCRGVASVIVQSSHIEKVFTPKRSPAAIRARLFVRIVTIVTTFSRLRMRNRRLQKLTLQRLAASVTRANRVSLFRVFTDRRSHAEFRGHLFALTVTGFTRLKPRSNELQQPLQWQSLPRVVQSAMRV